jgi:hypothetical protein
MPVEPIDASVVGAHLAAQLEQRGIEYALGGALALGYWAEPRGTLDVDVTLFIEGQSHSHVVDLLFSLGWQASRSDAIRDLQEHGLCRGTLEGRRVDVFLPMIDFHEQAKARRVRVSLHGQPVMVWSAETLAIFKVMFFRGKDLVDVERMLVVQGSKFDRDWVRGQLVEIFGARDPRSAAWDELAARVPAE